MGDWFIYQPNGNHFGPVTTDLLVRGVHAGKVPRDAHVAPRGGSGWVALLAVPELVAALAGPVPDVEPPRTVPPARPPTTTLPPPASLAAPPLPKVEIAPDPAPKPEPTKAEAPKAEPPKVKPIPMRPLIPIGIFGIFVVMTLIVGVLGAIK